MSFDLVIEVDNQPGALAHVAAAVSDAGVNLAAATCLGKGDRTELHILVPHAEPVRHALALTHEASITREREVCVVEVHDDQPGVLADLARSVADAVGYRGALTFDGSKPDGTPRKLMSAAKLRGMGWAPTRSLPEGLAETYRWFLGESGLAA